MGTKFSASLVSVDNDDGERVETRYEKEWESDGVSWFELMNSFLIMLWSASYRGEAMDEIQKIIEDKMSESADD